MLSKFIDLSGCTMLRTIWLRILVGIILISFGIRLRFLTHLNSLAMNLEAGVPASSSDASVKCAVGDDGAAGGCEEEAKLVDSGEKSLSTESFWCSRLKAAIITIIVHHLPDNSSSCERACDGAFDSDSFSLLICRSTSSKAAFSFSAAFKRSNLETDQRKLVSFLNFCSTDAHI